MRSFLNYLGGKSRLAPRLAAMMPPGRPYVEVFGGAAWVLFAREPSPVEVYNDREGRLVNLFRVVRDKPGALARELALLPRSRRLYYELLRRPEDGGDVRAAAVYYFLVKNAFSGRPGCGFSSSVKFPGRYRMLNDFAAFAARLARVTLEDLSYEDCVRRYDGPDAVFYLDPPYVGKENYYGGAFGSDDHERLRTLLGSLTGRWLVTYNDVPRVRRWYRGYNVTRLATAYCAAKVVAGARRAAVPAELAITNY
jgi:DNA adenine methylase